MGELLAWALGDGVLRFARKGGERIGPMFRKENVGCSLWVKNITTMTRANDLKTVFSKYGTVNRRTRYRVSSSWKVSFAISRSSRRRSSPVLSRGRSTLATLRCRRKSRRRVAYSTYTDRNYTGEYFSLRRSVEYNPLSPSTYR